MKWKYCVLAMLWPAMHCFAQTRPLCIGDIMPDHPLTLLHHPTGSARISDFNDRLLILDFFATWCTSCTLSFPHLDSLQAQFGNRIQIMLVSSHRTLDTPEKIVSFFERRMQKTGYKNSFPIVTGDTLLTALFPFESIPHYVWIGNGKVWAITDSAGVTAASIREFLSNLSTNH